MTKNVLITGGARGIGAATARLLASQGWRVCINYLSNSQAAQQVVEEITNSGGSALTIAANVGLSDDVNRMFEFIDREMGSLQGLVNNAGVIAPMKRFEEMDPARWNQIVGTNLLGTMLCSREGVLRMSSRYGGAGGSIVNLSTALTRSGAPNMYVDYAASKSAIETLTVGLAREVAADGVRVNCVCPGVVDTEMIRNNARLFEALQGITPMGHMAAPDQIAEVMFFLLSPQSSYVTGTDIAVDGGVTAGGIFWPVGLAVGALQVHDPEIISV
jgi:NAD(P)-dependent dehydrogenase (short-subunit alcohol dehydrogenase family)